MDEVILQKSDTYADQVEIDRLFGMGVITTHEKFSRDLGTQLSAKFVRSWRKKTRNGVPGWLRRSRLVAWLDVRDDVYNPSSNSAIVKLLPALAQMDSTTAVCWEAWTLVMLFCR